MFVTKHYFDDIPIAFRLNGCISKPVFPNMTHHLPL